MRISKRPIDPNNMDLHAMVTESVGAIAAADPLIVMEIIEQIAFLSRTRDDVDAEIIEIRGQSLDDLVETIADAMYKNYDRECAAA
jgi:hypothetical protein